MCSLYCSDPVEIIQVSEIGFKKVFLLNAMASACIIVYTFEGGFIIILGPACVSKDITFDQ